MNLLGKLVLVSCGLSPVNLSMLNFHHCSTEEGLAVGWDNKNKQYMVRFDCIKEVTVVADKIPNECVRKK